MKKYESDDEEEYETEKVVAETINDVLVFPCLLVFPKVLSQDEFLHYLKETKKRSSDSNSKSSNSDSYES